MEWLRINVAGLLKEGTGAAREYDLRVPPTHQLDGLTLAAALVGRARLLRLMDGILVHGDFFTSVQVECSRCLAAVDVPIDFHFDEQYYPQVDIVTGERQAARPDDLGLDINPNHEIDLTEPVRQHVLLALPMQPVCRAACAGLCPVCGKNWNEGPCGHEASEDDPRLTPLRALLEGAHRTERE